MVKRAHVAISPRSESLAKRWRHYEAASDGMRAELLCAFRIFAMLCVSQRLDDTFGPLTKLSLQKKITDYMKYIYDLLTLNKVYNGNPNIKQLQSQILMSVNLRNDSFIEKHNLYLSQVVKPALEKLKKGEGLSTSLPPVFARTRALTFDALINFFEKLIASFQQKIENLNDEVNKKATAGGDQTRGITVRIAASKQLEKVQMDLLTHLKTLDEILQSQDKDIDATLRNTRRDMDAKDRCFDILSDVYDKHGYLIMNYLRETDSSRDATPKADDILLSYLKDINPDFWC